MFGLHPDTAVANLSRPDLQWSPGNPLADTKTDTKRVKMGRVRVGAEYA